MDFCLCGVCGTCDRCGTVWVYIPLTLVPFLFSTKRNKNWVTIIVEKLLPAKTFYIVKSDNNDL